MTKNTQFTNLIEKIANIEGSPEVISQLAHTSMMALHIKAMACHCECLGMNAENALAVCGNYTPPYTDKDYYEVMQKWELMDEKGNPII